MKAKRAFKLATVAFVIGVPIISAPKPKPGLANVATIDDAIKLCQASGKIGWELVDYATSIVNQKFSAFSIWHLWESPSRAFRGGRGFSDQYNLALALILRALGFQLSQVHAARVRFEDIQPAWWHSGHSWLRVSYDGRVLDVCASRPQNRAGHVAFTPISDVRVMNPWTITVMRILLAPFVIWQVWRHMLSGKQVPPWFYRSPAFALQDGQAPQP